VRERKEWKEKNSRQEELDSARGRDEEEPKEMRASTL